MPRTKFDDEHRIFLQGIMCKGILNDKEVHALHSRALKACSIEIPDKKPESVIKPFLQSKILTRFGAPRAIITDNRVNLSITR